MSVPNAERIFFIRHALRAGFTIEEIFNLTKIDRWFLVQIKEIVDFEEELAGAKIKAKFSSPFHSRPQPFFTLAAVDGLENESFLGCVAISCPRPRTQLCYRRQTPNLSTMLPITFHRAGGKLCEKFTVCCC